MGSRVKWSVPMQNQVEERKWKERESKKCGFSFTVALAAAAAARESGALDTGLGRNSKLG